MYHTTYLSYGISPKILLFYSNVLFGWFQRLKHFYSLGGGGAQTECSYTSICNQICMVAVHLEGTSVIKCKFEKQRKQSARRPSTCTFDTVRCRNTKPPIYPFPTCLPPNLSDHQNSSQNSKVLHATGYTMMFCL